jgi:hypothetical protein
MPNEPFNFNVFLQESKDTIFKPKEYFSTMKTTGGLGEPVIKALIYGAFSGALTFIFSILHLMPAGGGMFGSSVSIMIFIGSIIGSVIGLFIAALLTLIISAICKGNTEFEANARVAAAILVLMPVRAILGFLYGININLAMIAEAIVSFYGIYLLFFALTQSLKANESSSKIVSYVLAGLWIILTIAGLMAKQATTGFLEKMNKNGVVDDYSNELKKYQEELEKSTKEFEQAAKEAEEDLKEDAEVIGDTLSE